MSIQIQNEINQIRQRLGMDFAGIALSRVNTGTNARTIHWQFVSGNKNDHYKRIRLQVGKGIAGIVWRTGRSYQGTRLLAKPANLLELPIVRMEKLETAVASPVLKDGRVLAVLLLGDRKELEIADSFIKKVETAAAGLLPLLEELE